MEKVVFDLDLTERVRFIQTGLKQRLFRYQKTIKTG